MTLRICRLATVASIPCLFAATDEAQPPAPTPILQQCLYHLTVPNRTSTGSRSRAHCPRKFERRSGFTWTA